MHQCFLKQQLECKVTFQKKQRYLSTEGYSRKHYITQYSRLFREFTPQQAKHILQISLQSRLFTLPRIKINQRLHDHISVFLCAQPCLESGHESHITELLHFVSETLPDFILPFNYFSRVLLSHSPIQLLNIST